MKEYIKTYFDGGVGYSEGTGGLPDRAPEGTTSWEYPKNTIHSLYVYKWNNIYVFDKEEWQTEREAFVSGSTEYLEMISGNKESFVLLFSDRFFPESHVVELLESDENGSYYWSEELQHKLWLCSYLFLFYMSAPKKIYLQIK